MPLLIVLVISISTMFVCCKNDIETINRITETNKLPSFIVTNLETCFSDSGIVKIKIYAPELVRYDKSEVQYDEYPQGINVEFFNEAMQVTGTLKCNYAKYLVTDEIWEAKSDVEVNSVEKEEKINTELLYWDMKKEIIYSDKFVRITTSDEILFGEGFESNQEFTKWKILKPTGTIKIKDE
ncbi:MAG: LPS export ABC transporter periplasmic protein LptC [Bacteroidales bacterium]|nr:LPS export ABC transporter periplasmic protein LptC [Bacteroidales bacterium]MDD3859291.1 LPS export ABC transporter periplasmic protein LptC [Bacteroidales bacterium]